MTFSEYIIPAGLEEAWELNQKKTAVILGGNMWLRLQRRSLKTAVDLTGLVPSGIEDRGDAFFIGAMATLRTLETHEGFNAYTGGAGEKALSHIVGVQFRNLTTVGGSVWGRFGFSDVLTLLAPLDCRVLLYKGGETALRDFLDMKPDGDILLGVIVDKTPVRMKYDCVQVSRGDFPVLSCCAAKLGGVTRVAVGARPGRAFVYESALPLSPDALAALAAESIPVGGNLRASAEYRRLLVLTLVRRCCQGL